MSYSFTFIAKNKTEARVEVEKKFDETIAGQPCHSHDKSAALANVSAALDLLTNDQSYDGMNVRVSGSLSWLQSDPKEICAVSIGVGIHLLKKIPSAEEN